MLLRALELHDGMSVLTIASISLSGTGLQSSVSGI
tara:strand:- start:162 stop:266 length:105 start_codon:yes stop_codon:yes gene_type:complete